MDKKLENLKKGKKFTTDYQPTPEAKSKGKQRINEFKEAMTFLGNQLKSKMKDENGNDIELSFDANLALTVMQMATKGDLKAMDMVFKLKGFYAPEKQEINLGLNEIIIEGIKK